MSTSARSVWLHAMLKEHSDGTAVERRKKLAKDAENRLVRAYSVDRKVVRGEVINMLKACKRVKISEKHLKDLEDRVRVLALEKHTKAQRQAAAAESKFSDDTGDQSVPISSNDLPDDDYQVLMEHDRALHLVAEQNKRNAALKKKKQIKSVLDEQVKQLHEKKETERKEAERYGEEMFQQSQEYQRELARIKQKTIQKNKKDKEELETELEKVQQQKQRMEKAKQRAEARELERIRAELEAEKQRKRQNMLDQQAYMNKVRAENEIQKRERQAQQKIILEEDRKRDEMYYAKLEEEERKRVAHLEAIKNRSKSNQDKYVEATRARDEAEREIEEKIERHHREQMEREQKEHENQIARRKVEMKEMHASLSAQIARKEAEAQEEREAFRQAALQAKLEGEKAHQQYLEAKVRKIQEARRYKADLDKQVQAKSGEVIETKMNGREKALNASKFRVIHGNPGVVEIVKKNLNPRPHQVLLAHKNRQRQERLQALSKKNLLNL